ncbi:MerR family transcriptional regulator [Aureitalea marina]|uniref:MerR family transcriptional regulator n=1 Tax=Aureitalea marina TaxID=930804 RepID=A0A2S7KMW2_9FLAO|nr:MerR family transcriptional regulator [Aureitalea marina]
MLVKTQFSIRDLENLSGVKAHTIRIWEKRYNLLEPERTDTNIRQYDLDNLKKLLNVTFLYNEGYKISKIAALSENDIAVVVQEQAEQKKDDFALTAFKTAMFDFDYKLFADTYSKVLEDRNFREVFFEVFMPLLNEIGMLWQTGTIDPAHERFISELIKQKIIIHTEAEMRQPRKYNESVFVLYLPYEEIHEIGLLYANYELLKGGFTSVYLGSNIPITSLKHLLKHYENIIFFSYFTVKPDEESVMDYIKRFDKLICQKKTYPLWLMGAKVYELADSVLPENVKTFSDLSQLSENLVRYKRTN